MYIHVHVHVLMRDENEGRKKQARSTNNKAKQHNTPKAHSTRIRICILVWGHASLVPMYI